MPVCDYLCVVYIVTSTKLLPQVTQWKSDVLIQTQNHNPRIWACRSQSQFYQFVCGSSRGAASYHSQSPHTSRCRQPTKRVIQSPEISKQSQTHKSAARRRTRMFILKQQICRREIVATSGWFVGGCDGVRGLRDVMSVRNCNALCVFFFFNVKLAPQCSCAFNHRAYYRSKIYKLNGNDVRFLHPSKWKTCNLL